MESHQLISTECFLVGVRFPIIQPDAANQICGKTEPLAFGMFKIFYKCQRTHSVEEARNVFNRVLCYRVMEKVVCISKHNFMGSTPIDDTSVLAYIVLSVEIASNLVARVRPRRFVANDRFLETVKTELTYVCGKHISS